jgi:hypothetical protein
MGLKAAIIQNIKPDRGGGDPANVVVAKCAWDKSLAGKNLAQITKDRGLGDLAVFDRATVEDIATFENLNNMRSASSR